MAHNRKPLTAEEQAKLQHEIRCEVALREKGYRERALKLLPHVCARCAREFSGRRLSELTVHHRDHNWKNNPPDGSNWELLCLYCHDHEHQKYLMAGHHAGSRPEDNNLSPSIFSPFDGLDSLLAGKKDETGGKSTGQHPADPPHSS